MKRIILPFVIGFFALISSCKTSPRTDDVPEPITLSLPIHNPISSRSNNTICYLQNTRRTVTASENDSCSMKGLLLDENKEPLANLLIYIDSNETGTMTNAEGVYFFNNLTPGIHTIRFKAVCDDDLFFNIILKAGDRIELDAIVHIDRTVHTEKPIIYFYPEDTIEIEVQLMYDGEITTTYPKLPTDGWKVTAFPDGTLIDENDKEYYALYWEGDPREPLGITDGFVVSREQTIPFLEEKLAVLGLNPRESNEFIIFWLPILEKNDFNLIHFAGDDYLEQAQLNISPDPETVIRIAMVFQGLDEEIVVPLQDLTPLTRTRSGFTVVEWGGQELPKEYKLGI